jgi:hypothetical protein
LSQQYQAYIALAFSGYISGYIGGRKSVTFRAISGPFFTLKNGTLSLLLLSAGTMPVLRLEGLLAC